MTIHADTSTAGRDEVAMAFATVRATLASVSFSHFAEAVGSAVG